MVSGLSTKSAAPSLLLHDYNGKKSKIIQTLKQIDDIKSGVVKTVVFENLLRCLEVDLDSADLAEYQQRHGLTYQGVPYIKYEAVLRLMQYDNHSERWTFKKASDDLDTLSVIAEKRTNFRKATLRQSYDVSVRNKPSL